MRFPREVARYGEVIGKVDGGGHSVERSPNMVIVLTTAAYVVGKSRNKCWNRWRQQRRGQIGVEIQFAEKTMSPSAKQV